MRGVFVIAAVISFGACGVRVETGAFADDTGDDGDPPPDDPEDPAELGPWGQPALISIASDPIREEDDGTLSYSGLELVYVVEDANEEDLFYATRTSATGAFSPAERLGFSLLGPTEETPRFSADDLTLFFARAGDIYRVTRASPGSKQWGIPEPVTQVNTAAVEKAFMPCANDRYVVARAGDLFEGTLGAGPPNAIAELNSGSAESGTYLTEDCRTIYFASSRNAAIRIYTSSRPNVRVAWRPPTVVGDFAALGGAQEDPFVSSDLRTFVFTSDASGNEDLYISTR